MDKVSYALGIGIGHQLANMGGQELNIDDFAQAVKDVLGGKELKIKSSEAQQIVQEFFAQQEQKINKQRVSVLRLVRPIRRLVRNTLLRTPRKTVSSPCPAVCSIRC